MKVRMDRDRKWKKLIVIYVSKYLMIFVTLRKQQKLLTR